MVEQNVIQRIEEEIKNNKVVLFMKGTPAAPQCGFSAKTAQILSGFKYPFKAVDILANPEIRQALPEYSKWPTFPQVFIDGTLIGGCDIVNELMDSGELKNMLEKAFGGGSQ
jgi:monothiol glutaredoxin